MPASSANLGPGFDVLAAALSLELTVDVEPADAFELSTTLAVPRDRSNLLVQAFERVHSADGLRFTVASSIPLAGGLGSSASAVVAGLLAADALTDGDTDILALATELEGHPDNAAAALLGGFVICGGEVPARIAPPPGLSALLVVPGRAVSTQKARAALPASVPLEDAVFNVSRGCRLTLGVASSDQGLIASALDDRLHQRQRAHLYPRSAAVVEQAATWGALGATISGAGPTVLVWCDAPRREHIRPAVERAAAGWARVLPVEFAARGAQVEGLAG